MNGKLTFVEPKSARSRRTLALPQGAVNALKAHRARQNEERLLAGGRWQDNGLVFASTIGTPLDGRNVLKRLHELLEAAGLPRQRFHDLRHACASLLLAQEAHMRTVMAVLGHSQIGQTMNLYSHVMPAAMRDAADRMDAIRGRVG